MTRKALETVVLPKGDYLIDLSERAAELLDNGYVLVLHFIDDGYHCFVFQRS